MAQTPITVKENYIMNDAEGNVETVRRGYEAFNSADMETLTEIFDENASWHTPGRGPLGRTEGGADNGPLSHEDLPPDPGRPNKHRRRLERDSGRVTGFCLRLPACSRMLNAV